MRVNQRESVICRPFRAKIFFAYDPGVARETRLPLATYLSRLQRDDLSCLHGMFFHAISVVIFPPCYAAVNA